MTTLLSSVSDETPTLRFVSNSSFQSAWWNKTHYGSYVDLSFGWFTLNIYSHKNSPSFSSTGLRVPLRAKSPRSAKAQMNREISEAKVVGKWQRTRERQRLSYGRHFQPEQGEPLSASFESAGHSTPSVCQDKRDSFVEFSLGSGK